MVILYDHASTTRYEWVHVNGLQVGNSLHAGTSCNASFMTLALAKGDVLTFSPGFERNHFIPYK